MDINFLIISWRGFNGNKGNHPKKDFIKMQEAQFAWLKTKGITEKDIVLYGESLGTGIALKLHKIKILLA
jgi:hypothetical protein